MRLGDLPIRVKLMAMLLVACTGVLVAACGAFVAFDYYSTMQAKQSTLGVLTNAVGLTLVGPVAFRDEGSTTTVLENLAAEPTALSASVYVDDEGKQLTVWTREGSESLAATLAEVHAAPAGSDLVIERPIKGPEAAVGTLVVRYSTADVTARTWRFLAIAGGVLFVSLLLAALAANRLQRLISDPVSRLASAASRVQEENDYSVRATVDGQDELGRLAATFNEMLAGIQARDAELIAYQHGLEAQVAERTKDLDRRNAAMRMVLDNVSQGFVTILPDGQLSSERSAAFDGWFGAPEEGADLGRHMAKVVGESFAEWYDLAWEAIEEDIMPLEVSVSQMPAHVKTDTHAFTIGYQPIEDDGELTGILVVVSDVTADLERERNEEHQRELMAAFQALQQDRAGFDGFFAEAGELVERLGTEAALSDLALLKRQLHTLKGNAGIYGLSRIAATCHAVEDRLEQGEAPTVDDLDTVVQAWTAFEGRIAPFCGGDRDVIELDRAEVARLVEVARRHNVHAEVIGELEQLEWDPAAARLQQLGQRSERVAASRSRQVNVHVDAAGVRLPRAPLQGFFNALVHATRNAVDHGLEDPKEREIVGKDRAGRLTLSAKVGTFGSLSDPEAARLGEPIQAERWFAVAVEDDGRGIHWQAIRNKAIEHGLPSETSTDLVRALFADGLSTAETVTEISGRGAGSSALADEVLRRGGVVEVRTTAGRGTRFNFVLPVPARDAHRLAA